MKKFHTYQLAKQLYHSVNAITWPTAECRNQAHRASLSVVLNLAEGYGKRTASDRKRYYHNAMGSLREVQACLDLLQDTPTANLADHVGACLYKLLQNPGRFP